MNKLITTAVVAALALGACGGGGTGKKKASATGDQAAATKINLRQADVPSGWSSAPHQTSPDEAATTKALALCLGIPDPATHTTAQAYSPDFSQSQATTASSQVRFVKTDAEASTDLAGYQSGKGPDCFKQAVQSLIKTRLPGGLTPANLAVQQLQFPRLKDGTAAYQATFTIPVAGTNVPVYVDIAFFRAGRAEVSLATTNAGTPFDTKLEQDLAKKMADRA